MPKTCSVPGCERTHRVRGLCGSHDNRRRKGTPLEPPLRRYGVKGCSVPGCAKPHVALGFCYGHWSEHRYGEARWRQRTPDQRATILELHTQGLSKAEIARRVGCSASTVSRLVNGKTFQPKR